MRKIILSLLFSIPLAVFSQSLSVSNARIEKDPSSTLHKARITVTNNSSNDLDIWVKREIITLKDGHFTYFCWGKCYGPSTNVAQEGILIPAYGSDGVSFYGDLDDAGIAGVSEVKYTFYDKRNPEDKVEYTFVYNGVESSVTRISQDFSSALTSPYPNPARGFSKIGYDLSNRNFSSANVSVRNLTGSLVRKIKLDDVKGEISLDTQNLPDGIYTYSLVIDEKAVLTKKLIIAN